MAIFTMRMPDEDYEALRAISLLTGKSMSELIRETAIKTIQQYATSGDFRDTIEADLTRRREAAERIVHRFQEPE